MTATTPIYGLKYIEQGEPVRNTRQALEDNAKSIEAALASMGVPAPSAVDLAALTGRVGTLEANTTERDWRRMRVRLGADFNYSGGDLVLNGAAHSWLVDYDAGPVGGGAAMWDAANKRAVIRKTGLYRCRVTLAMVGGTSGAQIVLRLASGTTVGTAVTSSHAIQAGETYARLDDDVVLTAGTALQPILWISAGAPAVRADVNNTKSTIRLDYKGPAPVTPAT